MRSTEELRGNNGGGQSHKLFLYADNLTQPYFSILKALGIFSNFGEISGYKINLVYRIYETIQRTLSPKPDNIKAEGSLKSRTTLGIG